METTTESRIFVKTGFGEFASDWEARTDQELQDLHAAVQMLLQGELAYISLTSRKSTFYISEHQAKNSVVTIQEK